MAAGKLVWGSDLYKGFKLGKNELLTGAVDDLLPFQMLHQEDKTIDWIKAVADFYDTAGWMNVEKKAHKIQRNFWMRYGKLDMSDYDISPGDFSKAAGIYVPEEPQSPLQQFYPLAPNFVDVMRGEFIKKDNTWTIEAIDPNSIAEAFEYKNSQFHDTLRQIAQLEKSQTLAKMGLTPEVDPEQFEQQMQQAMQQFEAIEIASKNFRTTGVKWAEKVLKIHEKRYNLHELEPDGFESGLISDSEFWHIDLLDDDFKVELLNPKWCDYHKGPNVKYVSDGDYFLWFDFMSAGDIVNKFGRRMTEEDILKLKEVYAQTANLIVPDYLKSRQGSYYDRTKSWAEATDKNPAMNDVMLGKELAYNYMRSPNFDHNLDSDIFSPTTGRNINGKPQMFRIMRLYWRSMKRIGWLTRIHRDGTRDQPEWVDENYKITIEPVYDQSRVKEKTKDNLLYGEHIDWTWTPDWRHVIKISPNHRHTFWGDNKADMESIYIDGASVKFQFKGRTNPFDSLPPVEGCSYSYVNTDPHSFIDRIRPMQIMYNIFMNKVPRKALEDKGIKIAIDKRSFSTNNLDPKASGMSPRDEYEARLDDSQILEYSFTRESLEGLGQPALPTLLNLSTAQEAQFYLNAADQIKWMAGETIGITRQRVGGQKASETATGIQQGIAYSETQTEKYFEQHSNLMQRFRQRMLDAAQYYSTFQETSKTVYMNDRDENVFLNIEAMDNLFPHYNIYLQSRANVRAALNTIATMLMQNTVEMKTSARMEAVVSNSIPKIMSLVQRSELEQEQREEAARQAELEQRQREAEIQAQMQEQKLAYEAEQAELDRQSEQEIATIRAFGGLQSDNNANGTIDSSETLNAHFRQRELEQKDKIAGDTLSAKRQSDQQRMLLEREKALLDIQKERIKQEGALKVAKENTRKKG